MKTLGTSMNDNTPDERAATRLKLAERSEEQKRAMRRQKVRIGKRASIGKDWDGKADNDNVSLPVLKALLAEGNNDLAKYVLRYRQIHDAANSDVVLGGKGVATGAMAIDHRTWFNRNGELAYKGERKLTAAAFEGEAPAMRATPTNPDSKKNATPVPRPWAGDRFVNDAIDAKSLLEMLRGRLGSIVEPFELAVIDGKTLAEVGNAAGIANRAGAQGAGRAIIHMGLVTVRDSIGPVKRRDLAAA